MYLVAPDILADACGLSMGLTLVGVAVGLALWLFGWRGHRFWIVLIATVVAGVFGLHQAPALKSHPLILAVLFALAAGMLALALIRLLAFLAGGSAGLILLHTFAPNVDQPVLAFLVGGLAGLLLFRWCLMALTSLAGSVLLGYAGLMLLNQNGALDAVAWIDQGATLLNWLCGLMAVMGFLFQFLTNRRPIRKSKSGKKDKDDESILGGGFLFGLGKSLRKAG